MAEKGFMSKQLFILPLLIVGCASTHNRYQATPNGASVDQRTSAKGLNISSQEVRDLRLKNYANFDFTIENMAKEKVNVRRAYLDFSASPYGKDVRILEGNDLVMWADVAQRELVIREYNTQMILASAALLGAVATTSSSSSTATGGAIVSATALGASAGQGVKGAVRDLQRSSLYPRNDQDTPTVPRTHLYSENMHIPPGLYAKKWTTIYHPDEQKLRAIRVAKLWLEYEDGTKESFDVRFRSDRSAY